MLRYDRPYTYYHPRIEVTDEGSRFETYEGLPALTARMTVYPASSRRMLEIYGPRLNQMLNAITFNSEIKIGDGVCVESDDPDHKVVGRRVYSQHYELDLERM